jgi:hypothetical protein
MGVLLPDTYTTDPTVFAMVEGATTVVKELAHVAVVRSHGLVTRGTLLRQRLGFHLVRYLCLGQTGHAQHLVQLLSVDLVVIASFVVTQTAPVPILARAALRPIRQQH